MASCVIQIHIKNFEKSMLKINGMILNIKLEIVFFMIQFIVQQLFSFFSTFRSFYYFLLLIIPPFIILYTSLLFILFTHMKFCLIYIPLKTNENFINIVFNKL